MLKKPYPRGIANHNPGNIRRSKDPWQGLASLQPDREFFTFQSAIYGIRALARLLITYQDKHGLRTIGGIINRFAPRQENNTDAYIQSVVIHSGYPSDQKLDMHRFQHLKPLVEAIIFRENGCQPYTEAELTKALMLAGVEPKQQSLQKTRTVKAGQAATAGTLSLGAVQVIQETLESATNILLRVAPYIEMVKWLLLGITFIGIAVMLWARIDDHRKGLR